MNCFSILGPWLTLQQIAWSAIRVVFVVAQLVIGAAYASEPINCLTFGDVLLESQADVDSFQATYRPSTGECDTVQGSISIGSPSGRDFGNPFITNLAGLAGIKQIQGTLDVYYNRLLVDFSGLSGLEEVEGNLIFDRNGTIQENNSYEIDLPSLTTVGGGLYLRFSGAVDRPDTARLTGFKANSVTSLETLVIEQERFSDFSMSALTTIRGDLVIKDSSLQSLSGLAALTAAGSLLIESNDVLLDLDALNGLTVVDSDLTVTSNVSLPDLNGLSGLVSVGGSLTVKSNAALRHCGGIYQVLNSGASASQVGGDILVSDNDAGCNSVQQLLDSGIDTDADGINDNIDTDDDGDGVLDDRDNFPLNASETVDTDGDGTGNNADTDDDGDGVPDTTDAFALISLGSLTDTDGDGRPNDCDSDCANLGMTADTDDDGDGIDDSSDAFPLDATETRDTDSDGTGDNADIDDDNDGIIDDDDAFRLDPNESQDSDSDGIGNNLDTDDDGDGVVDSADGFPLDASESVDTDLDGVGDNSDLDDDGDGIDDADDVFPIDASEFQDTDSDGLGNNADTDDDGDGVPDEEDAFPLDPSLSASGAADDDGDGQINKHEESCGSSISDAVSLSPDYDNDSLPDCVDEDDDNDGVIDQLDFYPNDYTRSSFGGQKALIVAGGGPYPTNFLWSATKNMANYAYTALRFQGLTDDEITYLSEEPRPEVDGVPTTESIVDAILNLNNEASPANEVLIYFVDHGGNGIFKVSESELMSAEVLKDALDALQSSSSVQATFIYDACQSGSFIPLISDPQFERTVVTSSSPSEAAVFALSGYTSFSFYFWSSFFVGANVREATTIAKNSMKLLFRQSVQYDGDGDGKPNAKADLSTIGERGFGRGAKRAADFPTIDSVEYQSVLQGEATTTLKVKGVKGSTQIKRVSVYIDDPDEYFVASNEPVLSVEQKSLEQSDTGDWEVVLSGLDIAGDYQLSVVAENVAGLTSLANPNEAASFTITQTVGRAAFIEGDNDLDGVGDLLDLDDDNDGFSDTEDAFPLDAAESIDTDNDGTGNNADADDDGDGLSDTEEGLLGTDPLNTDTDRDDIGDVDDVFPKDGSEWIDTDGDGVGNNKDTDDDNDRITDNSDAFPLISLDGRLDTDADGYPDDCDNQCVDAGMISDADDDNDGFTDEEELADGTNPLSRFSCRSGCFSFDVDESMKAQPLTDGLLVIRHLFGFSGDSLTSGAVSDGSSRGSSELISSYLTDADSQLDIDGDGESKPLTDGLLLIRYLFGFSGDSLISGAIGSGAERDTAEEVEAYIKERVPAQ